MNDSRRVTRLAPSPTGGLHLGNARTFLVNWALARQNGWNIAFRIDDLDSPRVKVGADRHAIEDLKWLGLDWDTDVQYQTDNLPAYTESLVELASRGLIYPCRCTRSQIAARAASAPQDGDHELRYSGHCRPPRLQSFEFESREHDGAAWRLRVGSESVSFMDQVAGQQTVSVADEVGDFLVANKQGVASYQFAVNIDDARQGVTDVVRGDDLLNSSARQILVRRALGMDEGIFYWHLPLIVGPDGLRLAKRHCDTRLSQYREEGVSPERVIGLLAHWCGRPQRESMTRDDFLRWFRIDAMPRQRITFQDEEHQWLISGS